MHTAKWQNEKQRYKYTLTLTDNNGKHSKLAQREYNGRHDLVGKVIPKELCKKFKFDHTKKCYMHSLTSVLKNETHKLL